MTLLAEIRDAALDSNVNLADLLRKCLVLAARLKHDEFRAWVSAELQGYDFDDTDLPDYRCYPTGSVGHFSGPFGSGLRNAPIPAHLFPEPLRTRIVTHRFVQPVGELEQSIKSGKKGMLSAKWSGDQIAFTQHRVPIYPDMVLVDAWKPIPTAAIAGVLDTVRTRVLEFVLAIEAESPGAGDVEPQAPPALPQETVTNIFNTTIHGGQANIGTGRDASISGSTASARAIEPAKRDQAIELLAKLREEAAAIVDGNDREEATTALAKLERQLTKADPDPERVKDYVKLYATIVAAVSPTFELFQRIINGIFGW